MSIAFGLQSSGFKKSGRKKAAIATVLVAVSALAACTPPPPPAPPPPPPRPVAVVIPPRPLPPGSAAANMMIPVVGPDGKRITVNSNLTPEERLWHMRAGFNVAALNCTSPQHMIIADHYNQFLRTHARGLAAANTAVDRKYRASYGSAAQSTRDRFMTQVYNHFALPPASAQFCDASLLIAQESVTVPTANLTAFGDTSLARMDAVFDGFYASYEQWQRDLAAWDARYAPAPAASPAAAPAPVPTPGG